VTVYFKEALDPSTTHNFQQNSKTEDIIHREDALHDIFRGHISTGWKNLMLCYFEALEE
jgi:hypothetical protein